MTLVVYGVPMPKGSHTPVVRGGRAILLDARRGPARKAFATWERALEREALNVVQTRALRFDGPLNLCARFFMPRPKCRKYDVWHTTKPDCVKLLRAVEDPLVVAGLIRDDSRIVSYNGSEKRYATLGAPVGHPDGPRVEITITRRSETP